ncbi:HNH endonuclease [Arthrobacter pityocampae]|uniref:HNH endonuclease n=1 Tax=Arthrobacter pityocampae TaxID=547334 RepID=UPI003735281D
MPNTTCSIPDCGPAKKTVAGYCTKHYQRLRKHGDPNWEPPKPTTTCAFEGCAKPHAALGYCATHYMRVQRTGSPADREASAPSVCSVDGCDKVGDQRGMCSKHYTRLLRNGSPLVVLRERNDNPPETCTVDGCHAAHHGRGFCLSHYRQDHHLKNREARNQRAKANYEANKDYYNLKASRRQRQTTEGMTAEDIAVSNAYRDAIKDDPCHYCGGPSSTVDHVFPVAKGGRDYWFNLVRACEPCNKRKAAHCGVWFTLKAGSYVDRRLPTVA